MATYESGAASGVEVRVLLDPQSLTLPYEDAVKFSSEDNVVPPPEGETGSDRARLQLRRHPIRATVVVETARKIKMRRLEAEFISKQLVADEDTKPAREYCMHRQRVEIVTSTNARDSIPLVAGRHEFPVIFEVPSWLPATLTSYECRIGHFVRARIQIPANSFFALKPQTFTGLTELVLQHRPPPASNAMRYWAGERRHSASHIAVRTARHARIGGRLKFALSVKAQQAVEQCRLDLIQDERAAAFPRRGGLWSKLPAELCDDEVVTFKQRDLKNDGQRVATYPLPTIRTDFPAPAQGESAAVTGTSQPDYADEQDAATAGIDSETESLSSDRPRTTMAATRATVSNLTLVFRVLGDDLKPDFESPLFQCSHRLRLRLIMRKDPATGVRPKQVVFTIPVRLFEGDATCDDVPPSYDEIHEDYTAALLDDSSTNGPIRVVDQDDAGYPTGDDTNGVITDYETDENGSEASPMLRQGGWGGNGGGDERRARVLRRRSRADSVSTLPLYEPPASPVQVTCIEPPQSYEQAMSQPATPQLSSSSTFSSEWLQGVQQTAASA